jgi:hypothetical protein
MLVHTHPALLPNCLLLATEVIFIALLAIGIYRHNPGPRAFKVMYREVRIILLAWNHASEPGYLYFFHLRVYCGL